MDNKLSTKNSWAFIKRNKKTLLITFVASAIVSAIVSLFLPNYYKSQVLFLPSAVNSMSKSILNTGDKLDPYLFGTEKESEYILEMLGSGEILGKTIAKFNLKEHYGIKDKGGLGEELVRLKLEKNIDIKRSDFLGVKLSVWDKDPKMAASIANYMSEQLEELRYQMKKAKADSIRVCLERSKQRVEAALKRYMDSASVVMEKSNVYDPETFADRVMQEMSKQIAAGNTAGVQRLEDKMAHLIKYAPDLKRFIDLYRVEKELMEKWSDSYEQAVVDLEANIPTDYVVEHAYPSETKDRPKRSIIVIISALLCTLIAAEVIIVRERKNSSDKEDDESIQA